MRNSLRPILSTALIGAVLALAACATRNGPQVDPIFNAVPGGRYACANAPDNRNVLVRSLTSPLGQAALGGALGGLVGNQFGSGTGQDIATGAGAAAGVAAGNWNANRMADNRYQQCRQRQQSGY
ncbi:glycine zipper 2TM domain-containing protein [Salinisphaera sp. RV14]|uniref:glycine zipper 2TM domain-containing protein n=1 Tax=unclassified Salinisphaera TaxID=2649847 RepID=UPI003F845ECD